MDKNTAIDVIHPRRAIADIAKDVDEMAKSVALKNYHESKSAETIRRQRVDLESFKLYLMEGGADVADFDFGTDLSCWRGVSHGIIEGFKRWLVLSGYSVGTINVRLATIKSYVALAMQAEYIPQNEHAKILQVKGFRPTEGRNLDEKREVVRHPAGHKKARHTPISIDDAVKLKNQADPRDRLLMCLLIDHGFRCGEI